MALDESLIKEFVDVVTQTKEDAQKSISGIAKTVTQNGKRRVYVTLQNGSEIPISSGVDASTGDHVSVVIENHKARIVANISDPAAGQIAEGMRTSAKGDAFLILDKYGHPIARYGANKIEIGIGSYDDAEIIFNDRIEIKNQTAENADVQDPETGLIVKGVTENFYIGAEPINTDPDFYQLAGMWINYNYPTNSPETDDGHTHTKALIITADANSAFTDSIQMTSEYKRKQDGTYINTHRTKIAGTNMTIQSDALKLDAPNMAFDRKPFKRINVDYPEALTIDANGSTGAITLDITALIPDGYVPVMVNVLDIPTANLLMPRLYINDSGAIVFRCKNGSTTGASITANANTIRFKVLCVRSDFI